MKAKMVHPAGLEPATFSVETSRSNPFELRVRYINLSTTVSSCKSLILTKRTPA
jgi:hypothetical protein